MAEMRKAVESLFALILARFVVPAMMTVGLTLGAWIGNSVYEEIKALRGQITTALVKQSELAALVSEHERRLNWIEQGPQGPRGSRGSQ